MAGGGVLEQMLSSILNMLSSGAHGTKGRWPETLVTIKINLKWKLLAENYNIGRYIDIDIYIHIYIHRHRFRCTYLSP